MKRWAYLTGGAVAIAALLLGATAAAQGKAKKKPAPAAAAQDDAAADKGSSDADKGSSDRGKDPEPKVEVERRGGKKVFRITTTFVIEGRIQKPNAFYVLQRSQINYDWAQLKQDFVPRIVHSVSKSPF
jgi:DNA replication initiation complex subunit (GINS family)